MTVEITSEVAESAAGDAAEKVPTKEPLSAFGCQDFSQDLAAAFSVAAVAKIEGTSEHLAVLLSQPVVKDILATLAEVNSGAKVALAEVLQPALDAAAASLGHQLSIAREETIEQLEDLCQDYWAVPLVGDSIDATVLVPKQVQAAATHVPEQVASTPSSDVESGEYITTTPKPTASTSTGSPASETKHRGLELLRSVAMEVTVELGRTRLTVRELLNLTPGSVLELDRAAGSPADLLVNGQLIAKGEIVVVDENFGLRVTEIVDTKAAS